jgi:hypothetical protein
MRSISFLPYSPRRGATAVGCFIALALLCAFSSCKRAESGAASQIVFSQSAEAADLSVAAHFLTDADDVPGFFRVALADSGVIPVFVAVRNTGSRPLVIHSPNGMELDAGFSGLSLAAAGNRYVPVHPREVVARLLGAAKARRYKPMGVVQLVVGKLVPPLGGYYLYNEVAIGRFYRPLYSRSFYPALPSGMFKPVVIGPGETKKGFLYFHVESGMVADSVAGIDFRKRPERVAIPFPGVTCELLIQACSPIAAAGSVSGYDFSFAGGWLFALREGSGAAGGLAAAAVRPDPKSPFGSFASIGAASAGSGRIACASVRGDTAAVCLNFKSKSKLCLGLVGESPRAIAQTTLARGSSRVFLGASGVVVLSNDGFCSLLSRGRLTRLAYARLGNDVDDAFLTGDTLFAFERKKGLVLFRASRGSAFARLGRVPLREGRRQVVGFLGDKLVVLNKARESEGDTIALFMRDGLSEIRRMSLPGHVAQAAVGGSALLIQLEDGTLIKLAAAPLVSMKIAEAGFLPFEAVALTLVGPGFAAVGLDGSYAAGSVEDYAPGSRGLLETSVPVR